MFGLTSKNLFAIALSVSNQPATPPRAEMLAPPSIERQSTSEWPTRTPELSKLVAPGTLPSINQDSPPSDKTTAVVVTTALGAVAVVLLALRAGRRMWNEKFGAGADGGREAAFLAAESAAVFQPNPKIPESVNRTLNNLAAGSASYRSLSQRLASSALPAGIKSSIKDLHREHFLGVIQEAVEEIQSLQARDTRLPTGVDIRERRWVYRSSVEQFRILLGEGVRALRPADASGLASGMAASTSWNRLLSFAAGTTRVAFEELTSIVAGASRDLDSTKLNSQRSLQALVELHHTLLGIVNLRDPQLASPQVSTLSKKAFRVLNEHFYPDTQGQIRNDPPSSAQSAISTAHAIAALTINHESDPTDANAPAREAAFARCFPALRTSCRTLFDQLFQTLPELTFADGGPRIQFPTAA